jgi:hypothetical protein
MLFRHWAKSLELALNNFLPDPHQQLSESVLALAVSAAICPVPIPFCMLDNLSILCPQQLFLECLMLGKLLGESCIHDLILNLLPILPNGVLPRLTQPKRLDRLTNFENGELMLSSGELLRLEIMLDCWVVLPLESDRRWEEVAEFAVWRILSVEQDSVFLVFNLFGLSLHKEL